MTEKYLSDEEVLQKFYSGITEEEARVAVNAINMFCRDKTSSYLLNSSENILPRPVIRDENGELLKDYTTREFYLKLQEEIFEVIIAFKYGDKDTIAEEIADVITVCISYLNAIGYDEKGRSEIFAKVNEKNEKRGYFRNA